VSTYLAAVLAEPLLHLNVFCLSASGIFALHYFIRWIDGVRS
jgi:hypothetical protein